MILEKLDLILMIAGGVLVVVSIIVNIVSSAKLGNLSESINQFEAKFEAKSAGEKKAGSSDSRGPSSSIGKFDSAILPAVEPSGSDTRESTRYRPPGSKTKLPEPTSSEEGSGSIPPTRFTTIAKSGIKLPPDEKLPEKPPEAVPAPESAVSSHEPVIEQDSTKNASALSGTEGLSEDEQALLQEYLKKDPPLTGEKDAEEERDLANIRPQSAEEAGGGDNEVMEVVEDTRIIPPAVSSTAKEEPNQSQSGSDPSRRNRV